MSPTSKTRQAYQKAYQKEYRRRYRQQHKRIHPTFDIQHYEEIENLAKAFGCTPAHYVHNVALLSMQDPQLLNTALQANEHVAQMLFHLSKIGNNVNQIARALNTLALDPDTDIDPSEETQKFHAQLTAFQDLAHTLQSNLPQ